MPYALRAPAPVTLRARHQKPFDTMPTSFLFGLAADEVNAVAAAATAGVALAALGVAWLQLRVNKREARRALAMSLYKDYLALAMQNPRFSSAAYPKNHPRLHEFSNDFDQYERYEFYVAYLLYAAEEIVELTEGTSEWTAWRETLLAQLGYHALYLKSQDFPEGHWSSSLLGLVAQAIHAYACESGDAYNPSFNPRLRSRG